MPHPRGGYKNAAGKRIPGTTTILSRFKDSGGLLHWAFKQGQSGASHLYEERDKAGEAGSLAHLLVENHINQQRPPGTADEIAAAHRRDTEIARLALQAFNNYRKWEQQSGLTIVDQEIELVSEKHQFGGCPDAVGFMDDQLCIIDWKTSNGVYQDYLLQLAAYRLLWEEAHPDQPITGGFHLCRFSKQHADFAHHYWANLDEAAEMFLLLRRAYDLDKRLKKRVG